MEHGKRRRLTGPELLRRHITLVSAIGLALWLIPITLSFLDITDTLFTIVVNFIATIGLAVFVVGVVHRSQRINRQWRAHLEATAQRRHNEIVARQTDDIQTLGRLIIASQRIMDEAIRDTTSRLDRIAGRLDRGAWDIYTDAITDLQGGPEAVNAESTHPIVPRGGTNVVQLRRPGYGTN